MPSNKQPVSVLVVIYTAAFDVLLLLALFRWRLIAPVTNTMVASRHLLMLPVKMV